jgi:hypothetical protein
MDRGDHGDPSANEVISERRQPLVLILGVAVFDRDVLTLNVTVVLETLAKCTQVKVVRIRRTRCGAEKPNHRHRWPLRLRRERPRGRAAEQRDELAASCMSGKEHCEG